MKGDRNITGLSRIFEREGLVNMRCNIILMSVYRYPHTVVTV